MYEVSRRIKGPPEYVFKLAKARGCVAGATQDGVIRLIDSETFGLVREITGAHEGTMTDLQSVDGNGVFVSSSMDGTVKFWDIRQDRECVTVRLSHGDAPMYAAAVDEAGMCAASCGSSIHLFSFGTWKQLFEYTEVHFDTVSCLRFGSEGKLLSGGEDGLANVLNTRDLVNEDNGQCPLLTINTGDSVRGLSETMNDEFYVFSTSESCSKWSSISGECLLAPVSVLMHPLLATDESFGYIVGAANNAVLAGNANGKLIELRDDNRQLTLGHVFADTGHQSVVRSAAEIDGRVITAGEDGLILEWTEIDRVPNGMLASRRLASHVVTKPY